MDKSNEHEISGAAQEDHVTILERLLAMTDSGGKPYSQYDTDGLSHLGSGGFGVVSQFASARANEYGMKVVDPARKVRQSRRACA